MFFCISINLDVINLDSWNTHRNTNVKLKNLCTFFVWFLFHSDAAEAPLVRRRRPLLARAMRAALPLHLLMLLLLGVACLVPITEDDYSCSLSNNFARSLSPMLRYTNGPPPI